MCDVCSRSTKHEIVASSSNILSLLISPPPSPPQLPNARIALALSNLVPGIFDLELRIYLIYCFNECGSNSVVAHYYRAERLLDDENE